MVTLDPEVNNAQKKQLVADFNKNDIVKIIKDAISAGVIEIRTAYHKQWYGADRDYTYKDQYSNDDEWLEESWPYYADYIYDQASDYFDIDGDYERSWGPVDTYEKYKQYLDSKKEGK